MTGGETAEAGVGRHEHRRVSLSRIFALTTHTFTQLVRMKVFYFLVVFSAILFLVSFFLLRFSPQQELKTIKDVSFWFMEMFSYVFAVVGTAMLIPRDLEDRTLYTILSKPVPRFEYLLGKLLGMISVIFVSILIMDVMFCGVLKLREEMIIGEKIEMLEQMAENRPDFAASDAYPVEKAKAVEEIRDLGLEWNLQTVPVSILLRASVLTALTLLVSTFASTTIFTIILSLAIGVIALGQGIARERLLGVPSYTPLERIEVEQEVADGLRMPPREPPAFGRATAFAIGLAFPDFSVFEVKDGVAIGTRVPFDIMWKMAAIAFYYVAVYYLVAVILFWKKEL